MQLTNKSLAMLLALAIVVSIGGTTISLVRLSGVSYTGYASADSALANLSIVSDISITFTDAIVNFGTGYVNDSGGGTEVCQLVTNGSFGAFNGPQGAPSDDCIGFNTTINQSGGFTIRNDGNQDVNLNISSDTNAATFITGDQSLVFFNWSVKNADSGACSAGGPSPAVFTNVSTSNYTACTTFNYEDASDELTLDLLVQIPQDATPGVRTATITAIGYS